MPATLLRVDVCDGRMGSQTSEIRLNSPIEAKIFAHRLCNAHLLNSRSMAAEMLWVSTRTANES